MYKSILLPVDLNHENSWKAALPVALELAKTFGAELHLVTIVPSVGMTMVGMYLPEDFEKRALEKAAADLHAFATKNVPKGVRGKSHVAHGVIREEILKAADTLHCNLIVMAPRKRSLQDLLVGPNTEYVVRHAKCSVLVAHAEGT